MQLKNSICALFSLAAVVSSCSPQPVRNNDSQLTDQFSGSGFLYLDSADRQKVIRDLKEMVIDNYTLLKVKSVLGIVDCQGVCLRILPVILPVLPVPYDWYRFGKSVSVVRHLLIY